MAFASLKKKIAINNQALSEKLSKSKSTTVDDEYRQLSSVMDSYKRYLEEVRKRSAECLQPGVHFNLRPPSNLNGSHNQPAKEPYPHPEALLGKCCEKYAKEFDTESALGSSLICASEGFYQLAEAKTRAVEDTHSRFVRPIADTLNQDMKEITHLRKKAEHRRLAYEVERSKVQKGKSNTSNTEYLEAEHKFHESYEASRSAMSNFLESEAEHIEMLCNMVSAQLGYVQDAQRVLSDLHSRLQVKGHNCTITSRCCLCGSAQVPTCRALYHFEAENPFELSFREGDIIRLIEQVDDNWFLGELKGNEGHFPTTYVEVLVPLH
ncbi:unnamed protein product [Dicrocoelium dendriticum]|nr:unnamed protein product [Dicrocoelium dendriticum]